MREGGECKWDLWNESQDFNCSSETKFFLLLPRTILREVSRRIRRRAEDRIQANILSNRASNPNLRREDRCLVVLADHHNRSHKGALYLPQDNTRIRKDIQRRREDRPIIGLHIRRRIRCVFKRFSVLLTTSFNWIALISSTRTLFVGGLVPDQDTRQLLVLGHREVTTLPSRRNCIRRRALAEVDTHRPNLRNHHNLHTR